MDSNRMKTTLDAPEDQPQRRKLLELTAKFGTLDGFMTQEELRWMREES